MKRRIATAILTATLAGTLLTGCSDDAGDVSCNLSSCTVTLNRGVEGSLSVLGVDVELVEIQNGMVTLDVGGTNVTLPVGEGQGTQVAGVNVTVQQVTKDNVILQVTQQ